jgi:alkylation response protein AidB-like acyl-CoA dehydrogenase
MIPHDVESATHLGPDLDPAPDLIGKAREAALVLAESAAQHDHAASFPHASFAYLRDHGWAALPVPRSHGGRGASLTEVARATSDLATGDASVALALAMHFQTLGDARDRGKWQPDIAAFVYSEVVNRAALVNACASEPEMGSPARGGLPATRAVPSGDSWVLAGRKTFATMAPELDYFVIPAALDGETDRPIGRFLVARSAGVSIEGVWEPMGMRASGSHDLVLDGVSVPANRLLYREGASLPDPMRPSGNVWFMGLVTAVYLGVAAAAVAAAARYAVNRRPTALGRSIATLESIQRRLGDADARLRAARALLESATSMWDAGDRSSAVPQAYAAKVVGTNAAIEAVSTVMRVAGGASMLPTLPLERHFRDVQAGLFHPPSDDAGTAYLGRVVLVGEGWEP